MLVTPAIRKCDSQGRRGRGWQYNRAAKYHFQILSLPSAVRLFHAHYQWNATFLHKASTGCSHLFPHPRRTHGETRNLTDPPKSKDSPTRWLVHKAQCPTTDTEQFRRRDNGMPIFYCCHIPPCYFLPNHLNITSVKAQLR